MADVTSRIKSLLGPFTCAFLYSTYNLLLYNGYCTKQRDSGAFKKLGNCGAGNLSLDIMKPRSIQLQQGDCEANDVQSHD